MSQSQAKKYREKQQTGFQKLKSVVTSLMVTTTTVVVAVTVIPSSADVTIQNLEAYSHEIVYSVDIQDSESSIVEGSLAVILENQEEEYQEIVELGLNSGIFQSLSADTEYTLRIVGNKGFGTETLTSQTITTTDQSGGAITGFVNQSLETDPSLSYLVSYFISDLDNEFKSLTLQYATKSFEEDEFLDYQTLSLDINQNQILIDSIANQNLEVNLILIATNQNDETIELDNRTYYTPYQVYGSLEIHSLLDDQVLFDITPQYTSQTSIEYEVQLKQADLVKTTLTIPKSESESRTQFESVSASIENLRSQTDYTAILIATYTNPYTLAYEEKEVDQINFTTTSNLHAKVSYTEYETYYDVLITISDKNPIYSACGNAIIKDIDSNSWYYHGFSLYDNSGNAAKGEYHFIVPKPTASTYQIEFGLYSIETNNYMVFETIPTYTEE